MRRTRAAELTSEMMFWFALVVIVLLTCLAIYLAISKGLFSIDFFGW